MKWNFFKSNTQLEESSYIEKIKKLQEETTILQAKKTKLFSKRKSIFSYIVSDITSSISFSNKERIETVLDRFFHIFIVTNISSKQKLLDYLAEITQVLTDISSNESQINEEKEKLGIK